MDARPRLRAAALPLATTVLGAALRGAVLLGAALCGAGLLFAALCGAGLLFAGCAGNGPVSAASGDKLTAGTTYTADLDGDGSAEDIVVDREAAFLTITDGGSIYRSRDRWKIVTASLGDTDRDGLPEVVTLLDDDEGRHIGLFAYFGGGYRERLVTSEITPRPTGLEVLPAGGANGGSGPATDASGDLLALTQEPAAGQTTAQTTILRWNGFSFTSSPGGTIDTAPAE